MKCWKTSTDVQVELEDEEKKQQFQSEYSIPMEKDFREDVSIMCNLSQKIKENGIETGIKTGIKTGIETGIKMGKREMIIKMYNKGYTVAQIADVAEMDEEQVKDIIKDTKTRKEHA